MEERRIYEIELEVPIGKREGMLYVNICKNQKENDREKIKGKISVLGNLEEFEGMLADDGKMEVDGWLHSVYRRIRYHGSGILTEAELEITLTGVFGVYMLRGKRILEETSEGKRKPEKP